MDGLELHEARPQLCLWRDLGEKDGGERRENPGFGARLGRGNGAEKGVLGQTASFPIYCSLIDVDAAGIGGKSGTAKAVRCDLGGDVIDDRRKKKTDAEEGGGNEKEDESSVSS